MKNLDQEKNKIRKERNTFKSVNALYEDRELTLNAFKSKLFPIKSTQGRGLKILTPKQMFKRFPMALGRVKACNSSEHLLNGIRQSTYSLYQAKEIPKKFTTI